MSGAPTERARVERHTAVGAFALLVCVRVAFMPQTHARVCHLLSAAVVCFRRLVTDHYIRTPASAVEIHA